MEVYHENFYRWSFFDHLLARGVDPALIQLMVSDGSNGLLAAMGQRLPNAQLQRCITHKVRGLKPYLTYQHLPAQDASSQPLEPAAAKQQRRTEIQADAYAIYEAATREEAHQRLETFVGKWQPLEPQAVHAFQTSVERTFVFYQFDPALHIHIRTTNLLERQFREFRAKADEMGAFPNEGSCLTLFSLVIERDHAKHNRRSMAKT